MITYSRDPQQVVPVGAVKIIGLGGAGVNMLERIALDGMEGAELLALNTDVRTLASCMAGEKIQLGANLTKGLGCGGDPELGQQAVLEAESQLRTAIHGRRIVFLCVGLGGGTGSGAAPIVTRIAREEGAFAVVFATMPFAFEGRRRREQAETALNELAVLANALVTFDNNRMGELVLAKQGIHEAFQAADRMICESIKAVIRLVIRPGLINVGLDDLMSALRTNRSRCLFGSGSAEGRDRAAKALRNALSSPLLDQGSLLKEARTVLVHLCGGEDLTLFEIELLMQGLQKHVPEHAQVLFGAAVDPTMESKLSLTLISALPEDSLAMAPRDSLSKAQEGESPWLDPSQGYTPAAATTAPSPAPAAVAAVPVDEPSTAPADFAVPDLDAPKESPAAVPAAKLPPEPPVEPEPLFDDVDQLPFAESKAVAVRASSVVIDLADVPEALTDDAQAAAPQTSSEPPAAVAVAEFVAVTDPEPATQSAAPTASAPAQGESDIENEAEAELGMWDDADEDGSLLKEAGFSKIPPKRPPGQAPRTFDSSDGDETVATESRMPEGAAPKLKLGLKGGGSQSELSLDSAPRGRFEGESPNVVDGEDLDLPPFLRKKK